MAGGGDHPPVAEIITLRTAEGLAFRAGHLRGDVKGGEAMDLVGDEEEVSH
jgi:hypothetical protein